MHPVCSLARNTLTNYARDMSAVIKLADAFTKMPNLREVKCACLRLTCRDHLP